MAGHFVRVHGPTCFANIAMGPMCVMRFLHAIKMFCCSSLVNEWAVHDPQASMFKRCLTRALLVLATGAAPAQSQSLEPSNTDETTADAALVTEALCRTVLTVHVPSADVAYQPGLDIHGNAVAPADLPGSASIVLPETIVVPITLDLSALAEALAGSPLGAIGEIGRVEITGDRVTFNGQPLNGFQQNDLRVACREAGWLD